MKYSITPYNRRVAKAAETKTNLEIKLPKRKPSFLNGRTFGQKLAELRKNIGLTQQELGDEIGTSKRMVAYYEKQTDHPPTTLLPLIAKALHVSTDELLGIKPIKKRIYNPKRSRLWNRLKEIEKLSPKDRQHIVIVLDSLINSAKQKKKQ